MGPERVRTKREINARYTIPIVRYLQGHHPEVDLRGLLEELNRQEGPFYTCCMGKDVPMLISIEHLLNPSFWFSSRFLVAFYNKIQERIPDPNLGYKMGREAYRYTSPRHGFLMSVLGMKGLVELIRGEWKKYVRMSRIEITDERRGYLVLRMIHTKGTGVNKLAVDWFTGLLEGYGRLVGISEISVEARPIADQNHVYEFVCRYREGGILTRLINAFIFRIPVVAKLIEQADEVLFAGKEQITDRDRIIEEKTKELRQANQRLKELLETRTVLLNELSHRVKNNLQTIASILYLQKLHLDSSSAEEALDKAIQRVKTIAILHEMISRDNSGLTEMEGLLRQISTLAIEATKRVGQRIELILHCERVFLDARQASLLALSINELVANCCQHAYPEGSKGIIYIWGYKRDGIIGVEVRDNGKGFPPGFRLDRVDSLGLEIVKRLIVKDLKGCISIKDHGGATVVLEIPEETRSSRDLGD